MALSKEERIIKLKAGLESDSTPDYIKEKMKAELEELEKPEPIKPVKKRGNPNFKKGVKNTYYTNKKKKEPVKPVEIVNSEPIKVREFTAEEKSTKIAEYKRLREKRKAKLKTND